VLFAGAEGARRLLVEELGADFVALYRTRTVPLAEPLRGDLAVVASPSAAKALAVVAPTMPVVSIGPQTTAAAQDEGLVVLAEAAAPSVEGLVSAVADAG
jgi:uroporphyrinogen-III synthase